MKSLAVCTHLATEPGQREPEAPHRRSYFYRSQVWFHQFSLYGCKDFGANVVESRACFGSQRRAG